LVTDRTRISQRLSALLQAYLPQVLQGLEAIRPALVWALLRRWPTLAAVPKARPATLATFFREHNSIRQETRAHRMAAIKAAVPLTTAPALLPSSVLMIPALATPMQTPMAAIRAFDTEMEPRGRRQEDAPLFASLPGPGPV
jgi:hypothetical protein